MFNRKRLGPLIRGVAALLAVTMFTGCATQKVEFTSIPPGATVTVGKKQGITPCMLRVCKEDGPAVFQLPSGEEIILPLHGLDSYSKESVDTSGKVLGGSLMVVGGIAGGAGLGMILLGGLFADDESEWYEEPDDSDNSDLVGVGFLTMISGVCFFGVGKWIYPDNDAPVFHAEFSGAKFYGEEPCVDEDPRYEDPGFGARRLKKANP